MEVTGTEMVAPAGESCQDNVMHYPLLIWGWTRSQPWRRIVLEALLLLAFVLCSVRLVRP